MSYQSKFAGAQFVSTINDIARSKGIILHTGTNFDEYAELVAQYRPQSPLGAPFDPKLHNLDQSNAFWIAGRNDNDELVHTQAVRLLDLKQQTLAEYLKDNFRDFPPGGVPLDMDASNYQAGPGATRIRGRLAYHGEVWLKPGDSSYRGTGIAAVLGRYAQAMAMMAWSPDYVFGFMPQSIAFGGFAEREGYVHSEPGALNWYHAETGDVMKGFLIYNERYDLDWMLEMPVMDLVA
jgi:hypothetical protein